MARYTDQDRQELARRDAALIARLNTLLADEVTMTRLRAELAATAESVRSRNEADQVFLWQQTADRGYPLQDVASYDDWQKRGRHVRRGSKALKVISPAHAVHTDADGICQVPTGARTKAALFDISDTQPLDIDQPAGVTTQPHVDTHTEEPVLTVVTSTPSPAVSIEAQALAGLLTQVGNAGYRVLRQGDTTDAVFSAGEVRLPADLDDSAALRALAPLIPVLLARPFTAATSPAGDPTGPQDTEPSFEPDDQTEQEQTAVDVDPEAPAPAIHTATTEARESGTCAQPVRLELGEFGAAEVFYRTNSINGRTAYRVTAPHLVGTFTISPEWPSDGGDVEAIETVPQGIDVEYGDEVDDVRGFRGHSALPCAPIVYGIEVRGGNTFTAEQVAKGAIRTYGWRDTGHYTSQPLPGKSQARVTAVVRALILHWMSRPDVEDLRLVSARFYADRRRNKQLGAVRELDEQIAELAARRDKHAAAAAAFAALIEPEPSPAIHPADDSPPGDPGSEEFVVDVPAAHDVQGESCIDCGETRCLIGDICQQRRACRTDDCDGDSTHPDSWDGYCAACVIRLEYEAILVEEADVEQVAVPVREHTNATAQLSAAYGPQWDHVQTLLERAAALGPTEQGIASAGIRATPSDATSAAMSAAVRAAVNACRDEAWRQAIAAPCRQAAVALLMRDLLDPAHYRVLTDPWAQVLGPLHPDDVADATIGSRTASTAPK